MTLKDMLTEKEQAIIIRALKLRSEKIADIVFGLRKGKAREKFNKEQTMIYELIERLR